MLEHVVKNKENIQDILNIYHLELDELKSANLHITDFYNLQSGMKIKIPLISKEIEQILDNTESFVQKYYPKINELYEESCKQEIKEELVVKKSEEKIERNDNINRRAYPGILPPKNPYKRSFNS